MSGSAASTLSNASTTSRVARIEALSCSFRSTSSSGRSEDGKNCSGTRRVPAREAANRQTVTPIVIHLARIAATRQRRNRRIGGPRVSPCGFFGGRSSAKPTTGANMTGDHPGGQQRQGHHDEQRERVLAGIAAGEADGQEPGDGDQRAGEPRHGGRRIGEDGGLLLGVAALQAADHAFDRDHRIIDQQAEGDDQGAERDALKIDAEAFHRREDSRQHQRNRDDDDGAGAQAEAHHAHRENDGDGLPQRFHEFVDRVADRIRLVGDHDRFDADRQVGLQLLHGLMDVLAQREHVAAVAHRNRQAQAGLAVDAEDRVGRILVLPSHLGDVGQPDDAARRRRS